MSADVEALHLFRAYCRECNWWGDAYPTEQAADMEADEHDYEQHDPMEATR